MWRILIFTGLLLSPTGPALAQVEVAPLAAPDAFSTPARDTGLGADLWRGTPVETARAVLPLLANRPLTPAAQTLARRVLATGATGPEGSAGDSALAGGRAQALIALGDVPGAARILDRASGLERSPELARAAAETALLTGRTWVRGGARPIGCGCAPSARWRPARPHRPNSPSTWPRPRRATRCLAA
jgi:hypothetical protein